MRTVGIVALCVCSATLAGGLAGQAHADTARAWAAAKGAMPADAKAVVGVDVAALQKTQLFQAFYPKLHEKKDVAEVFDALKDTCKLDPIAVVRGMVVALSGDQQEGAVYVALSGVDRAKLSSCYQRVGTARHKDQKIDVKQDGDITALIKDNETVYLGWIGKDVLVVSIHAQDKPSLVKWMGGKGAFGKSDLAKTIGKLNTSLAVWAAGLAAKEIAPGMTVKGGYGTVAIGKGSLPIDIHAQMENADQASQAASAATMQLGVATSGAAQLPPELVTMLQTVTFAAEKDEVHIKANVAEKDLITVLTQSVLGAP
jgi:hypothetical protein